MEEYWAYPSTRKFGTQAGETTPKKFFNSNRNRPNNSKPSSSNVVDPKSKAPMTNSN